MKEFMRQYEAILKMALESGVPVLSHERHRSFPPVFEPGESKQFIQMCHRGYDRAQNSIFKVIQVIESDSNITNTEKTFRILLLRKIIDSILYTILRQELHVLRRLVIHRNPPHINMEDVGRLIKIANQMNSESRMTFALIADLSTIVHICDIVKIDHRDRTKIELIEVKSGKYNYILSTYLDQFESSLEGLSAVKGNPKIPEKLRKQALRMMKQRVRMSQAIQVIREDEGIDPMLQIPIHISQQTYAVDEFDDVLNSLCTRAFNEGAAGGVINDCIHISVAAGKTKREAYQRAYKTLSYCIREHRKKRNSVSAMDSRVQQFIPPSDYFKLINPISSNLHECACRPLPLWGIERLNLMRILGGELAIFFLFDISGFMWTAEDLGYEVRFSSRHETDEAIKRYGPGSVPTWGGRMIKINAGGGEQTLLSGTFSRFVNNLQCPRSILLAYKGHQE